MKDWTIAKQALLGAALLVTVPLMMRAGAAPLALDVRVGGHGAHLALRVAL